MVIIRRRDAKRWKNDYLVKGVSLPPLAYNYEIGEQQEQLKIKIMKTMKTIWKFETPFEDKFTIKMPKSAEILCVQQDQKTFKPCIWAVVESENELEERYFELFGTGHPMHVDMGVDRKYLGTYQYQKGEFAGHLFERL